MFHEKLNVTIIPIKKSSTLLQKDLHLRSAISRYEKKTGTNEI